jgi:hypothetical protein
MKKNLWVPVLLWLIVVACDKSQDNVIPSSNQKFLGMVLQTPAQNGGGLILLKDGRTINPVSGFNPSSAEAGSKFLLSFEPLTSASNEILKVRVIDFTSAKDSTFTPPPGKKDSTVTKTLLAGTYVGSFTYFKINPSHPKDTSKITPLDTVRITFKGKKYESPQSPNFFPAGGSGTFSLDSANSQTIHFNNTKKFPPSISQDLILDGQYNSLIMGNDLTLWKYNAKNNTISKYFLKKR